MASNSFGKIFTVTTWGESHGKAIGLVIDGCPAGINITEEEINLLLQERAPGKNIYTSPRKELDKAQIYSGVFENKTTGAPISIIIENKDADSSKYESIKDLIKPGHANATYIAKYGIFDYRGGGRASARETACRVAASCIAQKILDIYNIKANAYLKNEQLLLEKIKIAQQNGDSIGGIVEFSITNLPAGLGDPTYEKLEANLAKAMLSIPASRGFEIGEGFAVADMFGSEHNDIFIDTNLTETNNSGGVLGGISNSMPLVGRVAFKPTSSIKKEQNTVDLSGKKAVFKLPDGSRHDPCVAIRAVPVVKAMCVLVIADAILMNNNARI